MNEGLTIRQIARAMHEDRTFVRKMIRQLSVHRIESLRRWIDPSPVSVVGNSERRMTWRLTILLWRVSCGRSLRRGNAL